MTAGYERIGPGQVARLAWQVMGSNGPIHNPAGIRYLSADDPVAQALGGSGGAGLPGLYAWSSIAQIATLGLSAVNLGVSLQTLSEVRRLRRQLDVLQTRAHRIESKI